MDISHFGSDRPLPIPVAQLFAPGDVGAAVARSLSNGEQDDDSPLTQTVSLGIALLAGTPVPSEARAAFDARLEHHAGTASLPQRLHRLLGMPWLHQFQRDMLLAILAPHMRRFTPLSGEGVPRVVTPTLLERALRKAGGYSALTVVRALGAHNPLVRFGLVDAQLQPTPTLLDHLHGLPSNLSLPVELSVVETPPDPETLCIAACTRQQLDALSAPRLLCVTGQPDHDTLPIALAAASRPSVVVCDLRLLGESSNPGAVLRRLWCESLLRDATICLDGFDRMDAGFRAMLRRAIGNAPQPVIVVGGSGSGADMPQYAAVLDVHRPGVAELRRYWLETVRTPIVDLDLETILSTYPLSPSAIRTMGRRLARAATDEHGIPVPASVVLAELDDLASDDLDGIATRVLLNVEWRDLRVSDAVHDELCRMVVRVDRSNAIFGRLSPAARKSGFRGMRAIFDGPPGTGKTMAAAVVAREIGCELWRIDLSQLQSKYIGETEKNLARVLKKAARQGAALLFDEADTLFGKRVEARGSGEQHGNSVVNYLLQAIVEHPSPIMLTTNAGKSIDPAFRRRMDFSVAFEMPKALVRVELWTRLLPEAFVSAFRDDLEVLAEDFELTGGDILMAAIRAAESAEIDGVELSIEHLADACGDRLRDEGHLVRRPERRGELTER